MVSDRGDIYFSRNSKKSVLMKLFTKNIISNQKNQIIKIKYMRGLAVKAFHYRSGDLTRVSSNPARAAFLPFTISLENIFKIRVMAHKKHPRV